MPSLLFYNCANTFKHSLFQTDNISQTMNLTQNNNTIVGHKVKDCAEKPIYNCFDMC